MSTDEYVNARRVQLGKEVCEKRKVYLDTRFWILLREVLLGRSTDSELVELLSALRDGVQNGALICPMCETTFFEIFKQGDRTTRRATVALADELSNGVTLADHWERSRTEISYLLHAVTGRSDVHELDHLVWNKLSYVLGVVHPTNTPFSRQEERLMQKAFFDHMWSLSLSDMEEHLGKKPPPKIDFDGTAQRLNLANEAHAKECKSFPQVYRDELMGGIEVSIPVAVQVMEKWYQQETGQAQSVEPALAKETQNKLLSLLSQAIRKNDFRRTLRTAHIGALCHASFRWDKNRKLDGNWLHDFHHTEAAVGYCDVFLTEKPFADLLKQNNLKLGEVFPCEIISSPGEAVRALS